MSTHSSTKHSSSILIVEPYFGESHRRLIEGMVKYLPFNFRQITMPPRKWKWRMRGAALHVAELLKEESPPETLFSSSLLSLTDLVALGPKWLRDIRKIVYFHENQLVYPTRLHKEWDFHFGLTNVTTALAADTVVFNSQYNRDSFLEAIPDLFRKFPDSRPRKVPERITEKSTVLPLPLDPQDFLKVDQVKRNGPARIVWNHRWEFDKDPDAFFQALFLLQQEHVPFELVILGENFKDYPPIFDEARERLSDRIVHWGFVESRPDYLRILAGCDFVVSTAIHEFFGIAIMEAVRAGCAPILPRRLVYPELFHDEWLYEEGQLLAALKNRIEHVGSFRQRDLRSLAKPYEWPNWIVPYHDVLSHGNKRKERV